jgi:hypothetical protein
MHALTDMKSSVRYPHIRNSKREQQTGLAREQQTGLAAETFSQHIRTSKREQQRGLASSREV